MKTAKRSKVRRKPMSMRSFYAHMRHMDGYWRVFQPSGFIRADVFIPSFDRSCECCPVTAVCFKILGVFASITRWQRAARLLRLPLKRARTVVSAADNAITKSDFDPRVRERLIRVAYATD